MLIASYPKTICTRFKHNDSKQIIDSQNLDFISLSQILAGSYYPLLAFEIHENLMGDLFTELCGRSKTYIGMYG